MKTVVGVVCCCKLDNTGDCDYSDKVPHVQVILNCQYFIAQMCTRENTLAHNLVVPYIYDLMSYNWLTTNELLQAMQN